MIYNLRLISAFTSIFAIGNLIAEEVRLVDVEGREIQAEILKVNEDEVEILFKGKNVKLPMARLSEDSRKEVLDIIETRAEKSKEAVKSAMELPDGTNLVPGTYQKFSVDATDEDRKKCGKDELKVIEIAIAVPEGFDPRKTYPVFFVGDTAPGLNANAAKSFWKGGTEKGYIVIGAQSQGAAPNNELSWLEVRRTVAERAVNEFARNWPWIKTAPWYFGGSSGGAKNCFYLAGYLGKVFENPTCGVFMSACNELCLNKSVEYFRPPRNTFRETSFFVSNGESDKIAPPQGGRSIAETLKDGRYGKVRFELHPGGHGMSQEHWRESLDWFTDLRNKQP